MFKLFFPFQAQKDVIECVGIEKLIPRHPPCSCSSLLQVRWSMISKRAEYEPFCVRDLFHHVPRLSPTGLCLKDFFVCPSKSR